MQCFDVTLQSEYAQKIPCLPKGAVILQALPEGCLCSDLLPAGFSYKPMNICEGLDGSDDETYTVIKRLKNATFISDRAKLQNTAAIVNQLRNGTMVIRDGFIGAEDLQPPGMRKVLLPEEPGLFGLELPAGSCYRFFLKTTEPILPEKLQIGNGEFKIISCSGVHFLPADTYVLQCDLPLAENYRMMDGSKSCIKLGYGAKGKFLQAGSVIDRVDYFGSAVDI